MQEQFKDHIRKFADISGEEFAAIISFFKTETLQKKENLLSQGQICGANYFVIKGILRKFFVNEKGVEQTTEFAIENWWMTETFSFLNNTPTDFYIQAVEKTEIISISRVAYQQMLLQHPSMEKYFRCIYQKAYAMVQLRLKYQYEYSREALYHMFCKSQPQFLQRVPQYLIASYLGFTPEYLSEIRKKVVLKPV